jgi:beta-glucosidase
MQDSKISLRFPKRFLWGAATSAHQVEGGLHNQWTVWELENAKALTKQAEYKIAELPIWKEIKNEALDPDNYISGQAIDHFNRYEADFDIAQKMNLTAFRFSIEWSRVEPTEGSWDPAAIEHYRQYIAALKRRGLEPMMTLFHWTVPVWFAEKGGFENPANVKYFVRFAEKVLIELGKDLRYITTINEPDTVVSHGYITQEHPPQTHSYFKAFMVYRNLLFAHRQIYKLAHKMSRRYKVGFSKSYAHLRAADDRWQTRLGVRLDYWIRDDLVLWYVGRRNDFLGVNYYFSDRHSGFKVDNENENINDLGWEMRPKDLEKVLLRLGKRRKEPIIITETGVADRNDSYRVAWLSQTITAVYNAMNKGVQIDGYMHWSLFDNFEWAFGRWPRFGLVEIDYKTFERKPRISAGWYAKAVKHFRGNS